MTARTDAFLDRLNRLDLDDLEILALEPMPVEAHDRLLDEADAAARAVGRLDELDEAADEAGQIALRALSFRGFDPTWLGVNWGRTLGRAEDRACLVLAIEDAAIAAVVADVAPDTAAALAAPFERLAAMSGAAWRPAPPAVGGGWRSRLVWIAAAVALVAASIGMLADLAAEYAPSYLFSA